MKKRNFELRKLSAKDIFPVCDIIGKCGISEFKNCFLQHGEGGYRNTGISVVFDMAGIICRNISGCEKEIFTFLADISSLDEQELRGLDLTEFSQLLREVLAKEELRDFFTAVSELILSEK